MWLMYADGTGLLTDAMHDGRGAGSLPFPTPDGSQWEALANIHAAKLRLRARITVAGQWRILTALPEHSESGQRVAVERPAMRCHAAEKGGASSLRHGLAEVKKED
jgi:hypothetical protein